MQSLFDFFFKENEREEIGEVYSITNGLRKSRMKGSKVVSIK